MDAILDQISKLMAKAKGTDNENEAAIFAAKAAELLAKHNLTEAQLRARDAGREQGPIGEHPYGGRVPDLWRERIMTGVAKLYQCKLIFTYKPGSKTVADPYTYRFVGRQHNAIVAKAMAEYLFATVKRLAREYSPISSEQRDFRKGAGDRLYVRLRDMADAMRQPIRGGGDGTALMLVDEDKAVVDYVESLNVKTRSRKEHKYGDHAHEGWAKAGDIGLNTQVTETRASRLLS